MGWVRFDDRAIDHPKFLALSSSAFRLWFEGMTYCNKHLTDGLISRVALKGFRYVTRARIEELVGQVLWEYHDVGYKVHDYLEWNDNKETVLQNKERARVRSSTARTGARTPARTPERSPNVLSGVVLCTGTSSSDQIERERVFVAFQQFWASYPHKVGKEAAERAWRKINPNAALVFEILSALDLHKRSAQWTKDRGQFVPHPSTWLNGRRWTDQLDSPNKALDRPVCEHDPTCAGEWAHGQLVAAERTGDPELVAGVLRLNAKKAASA